MADNGALRASARTRETAHPAVGSGDLTGVLVSCCPLERSATLALRIQRHSMLTSVCVLRRCRDTRYESASLRVWCEAGRGRVGFGAHGSLRPPHESR